MLARRRYRRAWWLLAFGSLHTGLMRANAVQHETDGNHDGISEIPPPDSDGDGVPDYLHADADDDGVDGASTTPPGRASCFYSQTAG